MGELDKKFTNKQCLGVTNVGQCHCEAVEGSDYCMRHGGNKVLDAQNKAIAYRFKKMEWNIRTKELSDVIDLRGEIGVLKMLIEEKINACRGTNDLIMLSGPISDLVVKVKSTVEAFHKMEQKLGNLLDKQSILRFAEKVISILSEEPSISEDVLNNIADKIIEAIPHNSPHSHDTDSE